ncbi:hypothetical protein M407DRAFT_85414 [Tulasnella calospora MUT 4182]|uniref:Reverse transcriptase zinc-binding domain-containing protein n=1 Tax=Tulasnella calospora MUT 4182 TaxID=1051891 RepID=A0A0C3Q2G0_9AGAM|nr:hypothetical protein M407DRAFT_85414 [Tulasnella calospora MUT 4182]
MEWAGGTAGSFALADRCPPSTTPRPHFFKLPRRIFGLVTQARSGHAFMGKYYKRFVPSEETGCPCGEADPQTRKHIIQQCGLYREYRYILEEEVPDLNLADILGSDKGVRALAKFIAKSGAFKKTS